MDYTAEFLTEAHGDHLIARGRVLRPGSTLTAATVDVYAVADTETLRATALVTMRNLVPRSTR